VLTSSFSAEYGATAEERRQLTTKSGTNGFPRQRRLVHHQSFFRCRGYTTAKAVPRNSARMTPL